MFGDEKHFPQIWQIIFPFRCLCDVNISELFVVWTEPPGVTASPEMIGVTVHASPEMIGVTVHASPEMIGSLSILFYMN